MPLARTHPGRKTTEASVETLDLLPKYVVWKLLDEFEKGEKHKIRFVQELRESFLEQGRGRKQLEKDEEKAISEIADPFIQDRLEENK